MPILFNRCASLPVDPIISTSARSSISSSQRCLFHPSPSCLCFFPPSLPFVFLQGLRFLLQVSILLMGSFSILFRQCSYPVILMKILMELQVHHSSFFSSPVDLIQALVLSILLFFFFPMLFLCRCTS